MTKNKFAIRTLSLFAASGICVMFFATGCSNQSDPSQQATDAPTLQTRSAFYTADVKPGTIRYAAVGDSYTCGTGADVGQDWPTVLVSELNKRNVKIGLALNSGVDGWTTQQALDVEMPAFKKARPDFASLMIGVNDTYRETTPDEFHTTLNAVIDTMQKALPNPRAMFLVTIPDYSMTAVGAMYASSNNAKNKIVLFNNIIKTEGAKRHLLVIDVYPLSQKVVYQPGMLANDSLHPSAKQYALWATTMTPAVAKIVNQK